MKEMPIRFAVIASALLWTLLPALAADPFIGTWKLTKTTQAEHQIGTILKFEEAGKEARKEVRQDGRNPWSASMTPAEAEYADNLAARTGLRISSYTAEKVRM